MTTKITIEEWVAELDKLANQAPADGETSREMAARLNMSPEYVNRILQRAMEAGRLKRGQKRQMKISGHMGSVPCYWIMPEPKKAKR